MRRKRFMAFLCLLLFSLSLICCSSPKLQDSAASDIVPEAERGGDVVLHLESIKEFFNPYKQSTMNSFAWPCYEPLAWYKGATQEYVPMLAESWERDDREHSLTVHVRQGISFSNGDPLTAQDVYFTLQSRIEFGTQSVIGNPRRIELVDDYTVKVYWQDYSMNYELWVLTQYIFSKEVYDAKGLDWMLNNMVGTGPYIMSEYTPDVVLKFVRNPDYWGEKLPQPETITFRCMTDSTAITAAFLEKEIDKLSISDEVQIRTIQEAGYQEVELPYSQGFQFYAIPITLDPDAPLSRIEVRQALFLYGIDWDRMAEMCGGTKAYHTSAIGLHESPYYSAEIEQCSYDPDKAVKMLSDAGYPDGFDVTIYGMGGYAAPLETFLQSELKKLNINAEIRDTDFSTVQGDYLSGKEATTGITIFAQSVVSEQQLDRFVKHFSPFNATASGCTNWTKDLENEWKAVLAARSEEELEERLLAYCDDYVNGQCLFWPCYTAPNAVFFQPSYTEAKEASAVNCGFDPLYIFKDTE